MLTLFLSCNSSAPALFLFCWCCSRSLWEGGGCRLERVRGGVEVERGGRPLRPIRKPPTPIPSLYARLAGGPDKRLPLDDVSSSLLLED